MSFFYVSEIFSLIYFFIFGKYENHPRGNSLTVAGPGTARGPSFDKWEKIRGGTRSQLHGRVLPGVPSFDKWEKNPRGNSLTVAKAAVPPRAPPCRPRGKEKCGVARIQVCDLRLSLWGG